LGVELVGLPGSAGLLVNARAPGAAAQRRGAKSAAAALGIDLALVEVNSAEEIDAALHALAQARVTIVVVTGDAMFVNERGRIAAGALSAGLPTMFGIREHVEAGGLMSYGVSLRDNFRRAASYVDKILQGRTPANLPVELPTRFEMVLNLKTAAALGLTIPPTLLARADEVIE